MVNVIKEVCIFIIIAQAILFFVPGKSYEKYVRILVGIIMIMRFMEPLIQLFVEDEVKLEIKNRMALLEQQMNEINDIYGENSVEIKDNETEIYKNMEEEIKRQLSDCESDYDIVSVKFAEGVGERRELEEGAQIIITVSEEQSKGEDIYVKPVRIGENEKEKTVDDSLREMYAKKLGVDVGRLKVLWK